jgi:hypothetical protein
MPPMNEMKIFFFSLNSPFFNCLLADWLLFFSLLLWARNFNVFVVFLRINKTNSSTVRASHKKKKRVMPELMIFFLI